MLIGRRGRDMNKFFDDSNWRDAYKGYTSSRYELGLLEKGPKSLAQSWMMGALYNKWKKMKGYKDREPPDCQSSLSESLKKFDEYDKDPDGGIFDDHTDPYGGH